MAAEEVCRILTVREAADELDRSIARVRVFCVTGRIPARKIGKGWAMLNHDVAAFKAMERRDGRPSSKSN